ncbi:MAG: LysM peptidoglycan-binding domain-containing protein [Bacteroidota bacterium]|nr:LysM peptidoglycan-binding domain-containing protein [Bacteroidota bacterium]
MNNYIECPVCKASGIKKGSPRCPRCNSDLEVFGQINHLEEGSSGSTAALMIAYFLVLACVVSFLLFYFFVFKDAKTNSELNKTQIKQLNSQIEELKSENEQYLQQIIDLRTQIGGGADNSASESKNKKDNNVSVQVPQPKQSTVSQPDKQAQPKAQSSVIYHEVLPGESLRRIAKKYFGDMDQYSKIMKDNNIKKPDQIYPGQKLKIIR